MGQRSEVRGQPLVWWREVEGQRSEVNRWSGGERWRVGGQRSTAGLVEGQRSEVNRWSGSSISSKLSEEGRFIQASSLWLFLSWTGLLTGQTGSVNWSTAHRDWDC